MSRTSNDPRARRSSAAALAAATELLVEGGPERVTHAAVAERAGVGRATVYRHWPNANMLLLDALAADAHPLLTLGDGPVRRQLVTQLQRQAEWLNQPASASVIATIIERAERDEGVRNIRQEMFGRADEHLAGALTTAAARGELRPGAEEHAGELISRVLGPLLFQRFMLGTRLNNDTVVGAVDAALAPWLPDDDSPAGAQPPAPTGGARRSAIRSRPTR
ncbi:TetR/AcrR family transcriptional regulator [Streptomyces phaeolivaceus]|uniref:TetR/AcrR family transcriptional regulator n=1 Tax=Streptomyces phaeolivaceus TaxID=2653200 RepID=A0A5P8KG97_9ACTN|nr:TetR/AcrR family transcriptional regulator [Streptomyces phaeolivaceus]QFR01560.1 TetR/AcrR family transcriptional regulator [Streptomyces phaeolivaceus]